MLIIVSFKDIVPSNFKTINTTSRSDNWSRGLSPFFLGPVKLYGDYIAKNVENGYQFTKVYEEHIINGEPTPEYFEWAKNGWDNDKAERYPMGKGRKPLYSLWDGQKLNYIEARKKIYAPLYSKAVEKTEAFKKLKEMYDNGEKIALWDFDGYNNKSYEEVINNPNKTMGHAFVLAMMLENQRVWENESKEVLKSEDLF